jgi:hypothetical protein
MASPQLAEKDRAGHPQVDQEGDGEHHRRQEEEAEQSPDDVDRPLDGELERVDGEPSRAEREGSLQRELVLSDHRRFIRL